MRQVRAPCQGAYECNLPGSAAESLVAVLAVDKGKDGAERAFSLDDGTASCSRDGVDLESDGTATVASLLRHEGCGDL